MLWHVLAGPIPADIWEKLGAVRMLEEKTVTLLGSFSSVYFFVCRHTVGCKTACFAKHLLKFNC